MTDYLGTISFLAVQIGFVAIWLLVNADFIPGFTPFDEFPFSLLSVVLSLEAIFLTTIVLMSQNRTQEMVDRRDELGLHVSLLVERETTTLLRKISRIEQALHIEVEGHELAEVGELMKDTNAVDLAGTIEIKTQDHEDRAASESKRQSAPL